MELYILANTTQYSPISINM